MSETERRAQPVVEDMSIDIGASSREEVVESFHVRMAAPVVPDVTFTYDEKHDLMVGKAFDCRLGCASILRTLDSLRGKDLSVDVVGAFSVQEEMGTRGAAVTANTVNPDLAIVFEGCPADDHRGRALHGTDRHPQGPHAAPYRCPYDHQPPLPALCTGSGGGVGHPCAGKRAHRRLHQRRPDPPVQPGGCPVIVIGIPVRYIHTHYGIAAHSDVENAARLAAAILERMNADQISRF